MKLLDKLSLLIIALSMAFMGIYAYYSFYPFKVMEFENISEDGKGYYDVVTPIVKQGELLEYHSVFEKYIDMGATVSCYWEDGILFRVPTFTSNNPVGVNDSIRAVRVPETLPPGYYRYSCQIFYQFLMHREVSYQFYTDYFEVIE